MEASAIKAGAKAFSIRELQVLLRLSAQLWAVEASARKNPILKEWVAEASCPCKEANLNKISVKLKIRDSKHNHKIN